MDAIKKFFANFHKHGTISIRRVDKVKIIATNIEKTITQEKLKGTPEEETKALGPNQNEGTTTFDEVLEIPRIDLQDGNTSVDLNTNDDTECLKEFDEIMQEINGDIPMDRVSLDEINDVLNNIKEEENLKEESLQLETPRFDLQDLIQSFDICKNNLYEEVDLDYEEINELNCLDIMNESIIDLDDGTYSMEISNKSLDLQNEINVPSGWDHDITIEESDLFNDKDLKVQEDVISISSDDSQAVDENVTNKSKEINEPKNVNNEINEFENVNEETNDAPRNVDDENKETIEAKNLNDETRNFNYENTVYEVNYKNEGINYELRSMNKENKGQSESNNTVNENDEINNNINNENDQATKYVTFIDGSDNDCGYHSSDFEFITEDEAKLDGFIVNINPNVLKRKVTKPKRVKTIKIEIDQFSGDNIKYISKKRSNRIGLTPGNMQVNGPGRNTSGPGPSVPASLDQNTVITALNNTRDYSRPNNIKKNDPRWNNLGSGPINRQENNSDNNNFRCSQTNMPGNDPGWNNYGPVSNAQANGSSANNAGHSSLRMFRRIPTNPSYSQMHNPESPRPILICPHAPNNVELSQSDMQENVPKIDDRNGPGPTIQVNSTATSNTLQINDYNMQEIVPGLDNYVSGPSNSNGNDSGLSNMQEDGHGSNNFGPGPSMHENIPGKNNYGLGPSHMNENGPGSNNFGLRPNMVNSPEINNYSPRPSHLHGNGPASNNFGHGPTDMLENGPGPSHLQEYVPDLSDPIIERWRYYQLRNRLNRRQFVPDHSYRENHCIIEGEPYHQLFDPIFGPLPNHRSMRILENKSTLSKNTMLVEYHGLGFDMQMLRECRDNEDENVKKDADESAKKIFEMYPEQNRKKRRRF